MVVGTLIMRSSDIFRNLDEDTTRYLAAGSRGETFQEGDWVSQFDGSGDALRIVHLGAVEVFLRPPKGDARAWAVIGPRQCLPDSSVLPFSPWMSGSRSVAQTSVVVVPIQRLQAVIAFKPEAARVISNNAQRLTRRWRSRLQKRIPESVNTFMSEIPCPFDVPDARVELRGDTQGEQVEALCKNQPICQVEACPTAGRPAAQFARFWSREGKGRETGPQEAHTPAGPTLGGRAGA